MTPDAHLIIPVGIYVQTMFKPEPIPHTHQAAQAPLLKIVFKGLVFRHAFLFIHRGAYVQTMFKPELTLHTHQDARARPLQIVFKDPVLFYHQFKLAAKPGH